MDKYHKLKREMKKVYKGQKQAFGEGGYYQSLPSMGIEGHRPTDFRIEEYHVRDFIKKEDNVLDIGCNVGFFDIEIADYVNSITGVEYNNSLIKIGRMAAEGLGVNNIHFFCDDFEKWTLNSEEKFDVIFSFAVHMWLKIPPAKYANIVSDFLNPRGVFLFESQKLPEDRSLFDKFCAALRRKDFKEEYRGLIKDDNVREREFIIYRKQ